MSVLINGGPNTAEPNPNGKGCQESPHQDDEAAAESSPEIVDRRVGLVGQIKSRKPYQGCPQAKYPKWTFIWLNKRFNDMPRMMMEHQSEIS